MKFLSFKEFRQDLAEDVVEIGKYMVFELNRTLSELRAGLLKLTFLENFESFQIDVTIASGVEIAIRNELRGGVTPSKWLAVRKNQYGALVHDGDTAWDQNFVYLKNPGAGPATLTVVFFR